MCLYPRIIENQKYKANRKNGGVIPPMTDERVKYVPIGCGNCIECRKQKSRGWLVRLLEDIKHNRNGKFITLTFNNETYKEFYEECSKDFTGYELDNEIATRAVRLFLERWRKQYKKSLRHFFVTELGGGQTEHIHLHGIIWTDEDLTAVEQKWGVFDKQGKWRSYGYVWKGKEVNGRLINYVNERTVGYIVKYMTKVDEVHKYYKAKVLVSPGIGKKWAEGINKDRNLFKGRKTDECYRTGQGFKISLPIYYRNKIYSEEERELLWIYKIDKNERWVCGDKCRADDEKEYYALLHYHRQNSIRLGYSDDSVNWERYTYEKQRRYLKQRERLNNNNNKVRSELVN